MICLHALNGSGWAYITDSFSLTTISTNFYIKKVVALFKLCTYIMEHFTKGSKRCEHENLCYSALHLTKCLPCLIFKNILKHFELHLSYKRC